MFEFDRDLRTEPQPADVSQRVFGRVYELITGDPLDGPHPYVGKTTRTIHQRVHGPGGHTSPAGIAKDPWKARILPGSAGYRLLETIYDIGDDGENKRALCRAESFWIDRLRATHNHVRPVRPPVHESGAVRRPARTTSRRPTRSRTASLSPGALTRLVSLGAFFALFTTLAAMLLSGAAAAGHWHPVVLWAVAPCIGAVLAWSTLWKLRSMGRRLISGGRRRR